MQFCSLFLRLARYSQAAAAAAAAAGSGSAPNATPRADPIRGARVEQSSSGPSRAARLFGSNINIAAVGAGSSSDAAEQRPAPIAQQQVAPTTTTSQQQPRGSSPERLRPVCIGGARMTFAGPSVKLLAAAHSPPPCEHNGNTATTEYLIRLPVGRALNTARSRRRSLLHVRLARCCSVLFC